ncbi:MAG: hypothetical protein VST72_09345 [Nitrospirota bacterium]|nr:hypothetical protein [Nitrospirota bacterium]
MSLKDIEKLKERVKKDPDSKLFVPLGEAYREEGMLDDAVAVLLRGLERQPDYMSARVSLGKVYAEKGMLEAAKVEFESVINTIPDNLYAHKKLAEIYSAVGEDGLAEESLRTVLRLNPMDEDALDRLTGLRGEVSHAQSVAPEVADVEVNAGADVTTEDSASLTEDAGMEDAGMEDAGVGIAPEETVPWTWDETEEQGEEPGVEIDAFRDSLFGSGETPDEGVGEEGLADPPEAMMSPESAEGDDVVETSFVDIGKTLMTDNPEINDMAEDAVEEAPSNGIFQEEWDTELTESPEGSETVNDADRLIAGDEYTGAMEIYRKILASRPDDRKVLQRVEDLRMLLRLLGKDTDALIGRLNNFMEAVNKRRDEFFGST